MEPNTKMNALLQEGREACLTGEELADAFEKENPVFSAPLGQSLKEQFRIELLSWLLYLAEADGFVSSRRAEYINGVLGYGYSAEELSELMRRLDLHNQDFGALTPTLFKAAAAYDERHATTKGQQCVLRILEKTGEGSRQYSLGRSPLEEMDRQIVLLSLRNLMNNSYGALLRREQVQPKSAGQDGILDRLPASLMQASDAKGSKSREAKAELAQEKPKEEPNEETQESLEELMAQLNSLTGLAQVKEDVASLVNLLKIRKLRKERKMKDIPVSMHLVFTGNPGTGKTTVARLLGKIYRALGALSKGQLVEVDRSELVSGYVGQTAIKTQEVAESALGGVLFIDEAYSLTSGKDKSDFGYEAVNTLLVEMENHREDLAVIVAGYPEPMEEFLASNPGLKSRFNKFIDFPDYSAKELMEIFEGMAGKSGYRLDKAAREKGSEIFEKMYAARDENFANGRAVRNFFEKVMTAQANRLASLDEVPSNEQLELLEAKDLQEGARAMQKTQGVSETKQQNASNKPAKPRLDAASSARPFNVLSAPMRTRSALGIPQEGAKQSGADTQGKDQ